MQINQLTGIGIMISIMVIVSGCIEDKQNISEDNGIIEPTEKIVEKIANTSIGYSVSEAEIKKNSEISFKVGDKFMYQSPGYREKDGCQDTFTIERSEKVSGRDAYVVVNEHNEIYAETLFEKTKHYSTDDTTTYYYDKIDGEVLKIVNDDGEVIKDGAENLRATAKTFFAYWMLGLADDAKWELSFTQTTSFLNMTEHRKDEFRVVGREKVNNRNCFKVEKRIVNIDKNLVEEIDYFWVDVKKRILIKKEFYADNVKYFEENLVSEL